MRSGNLRGVTLALGLSCLLGLTLTVAGPAPCRGGDFHHTIPDLVQAVDVNTGGPYYAPPVPYGHYVGKDCIGKVGKVGGLLHGGMGLGGLLHKGVCANCGGAGCDQCGKGGHGGNGGHGGFFHHGGGGGGGALAGGHGHGGLFHHHGDSGGLGHTSTVMPCGQGVASDQGCVTTSSQCGAPGCGLFAKHRHKGCGSCGGKGCNRCASYDPCGACGGKGCGLCRGGGGGGTGCFLCGGKGCAVCAKAMGLVNHLLHKDKIKWFVGPGGPVPITPGYTPYVVTTRSPRDFLAFPPFVP